MNKKADRQEKRQDEGENDRKKTEGGLGVREREWVSRYGNRKIRI